jgi:hypothetical protein
VRQGNAAGASGYLYLNVTDFDVNSRRRRKLAFIRLVSKKLVQNRIAEDEESRPCELKRSVRQPLLAIVLRRWETRTCDRCNPSVGTRKY